MDAHHVHQFAASVLSARAWLARATALPQQADQFAPQCATRRGIDGVVDRFVRDVQVGLTGIEPFDAGPPVSVKSIAPDIPGRAVQTPPLMGA